MRWRLNFGGVWDELPEHCGDPDQPQVTKIVWLALRSGEVLPGVCIISLVGGVRRWRSMYGYEVHDVIGWADYEVPKHPTT